MDKHLLKGSSVANAVGNSSITPLLNALNLLERKYANEATYPNKEKRKILLDLRIKTKNYWDFYLMKKVN